MPTEIQDLTATETPPSPEVVAEHLSRARKNGDISNRAGEILTELLEKRPDIAHAIIESAKGIDQRIH